MQRKDSELSKHQPILPEDGCTRVHTETHTQMYLQLTTRLSLTLVFIWQL